MGAFVDHSNWCRSGEFVKEKKKKKIKKTFNLFIFNWYIITGSVLLTEGVQNWF